MMVSIDGSSRYTRQQTFPDWTIIVPILGFTVVILWFGIFVIFHILPGVWFSAIQRERERAREFWAARRREILGADGVVEQEGGRQRVPYRLISGEAYHLHPEERAEQRNPEQGLWAVEDHSMEEEER